MSTYNATSTSRKKNTQNSQTRYIKMLPAHGNNYKNAKSWSSKVWTPITHNEMIHNYSNEDFAIYQTFMSSMTTLYTLYPFSARFYFQNQNQ